MVAIGIELDRADPLTKASARAVVRNLSRMEGHLLKSGRISRAVLVKDRSRFRQEGAGRYGLSDEDRALLRSDLGIYDLPA